jgi:peptidoglycan/xylan/chitin deacetylase (PgdA/CDA1 family)
MRNAGRFGWLALWIVLLAVPAHAQQDCAPNGLGVSRTIEVDTAGGPWFGAPFGDPDFLAPGEVVLTFDDGPTPNSTRSILAALAAECTKATFFVLGEMATANPDVMREIDAQGHTIGTHTWSHPNLKRLSEENMKVQIESAFAAAETSAGHPIAPFFRYPYLSHTRAGAAYLQSRNIAQFDIDIDSFDWRTRNAKTVVRQLEASLNRHDRGIILLHDIHPSTAAALPEILALLKRKGWKLVHLKAKAPVETIASYGPPLAEHRSPAPVRRRVVHAKPSQIQTGWKWPAW